MAAAAVVTPSFSAASMAAIAAEATKLEGIYALIRAVTKAIKKRARASKYYLKFVKIDGWNFVEKYGESVHLGDHFEVQEHYDDFNIKWRKPEDEAVFRTHFEDLGFYFYTSYHRVDSIEIESLVIGWDPNW